jgi:hypothetical protein
MMGVSKLLKSCATPPGQRSHRFELLGMAQLFMGLVERRGSFGDAGLQGLVKIAQPCLADLERSGALLGSFARRDQIPLIGSAIGRIDEHDPRTDRSALHIHSPPFRQDRQAPAFSASQINGDLPDDALPVKKRRHMGLEKNPTGRRQHIPDFPTDHIGFADSQS